MRVKKSLLTATVVGLLIVGSAAPAFAGTADTGAVTMMVRVNGQEVPFDSSFPTQPLHLHGTPPIQSTGPHTNLINFDQWYGCYTLNHDDDIFATFYTPSQNEQPGREINLRCGNSSYGYKHIESGKKADWQAKFDGAVNAGWIPQSQGMQSWDDLMAVAAGDAISYPNFSTVNQFNQTTCAVVNVDFYKEGVGLVYTFNARAAYSNTNDRLITAFPQSSTICPPGLGD
ncbi:hypothetical protein [Subtercola vilae]|uniref:DUF4360 domain-containing protein n=1 Tax=Subtercola vilae TaxID=2056433 RepID=A0A4T2BXT0_9MICO|nr:hypothetical protein [Subtercola vilae]TIH36139.1 hypothetical protein D4765_10140 [Subtercola vilae]